MSHKTLTDQAIAATLKQNWVEAIELNLGILNETPTDIAALNRLAKAYKEAGEVEKAKETYEQVLKLDRFNDIAKKNISYLINSNNSDNNYKKVIDTNFLEIPGKTKTYQLLRVTKPSIINALQPGEVVTFVAKMHTALVTTCNGEKIGFLPDDVAFLLKRKMEQGTKYSLSIKAINYPKVSVFLRELA